MYKGSRVESGEPDYSISLFEEGDLTFETIYFKTLP